MECILILCMSPYYLAMTPQKNSVHACMSCNLAIKGREHALSCSVCSKLYHRRCNTGIDHVVYRLIQQGKLDLFRWKCHDCRSVLEEPGVMNHKEDFLHYFALKRVVHEFDSGDKSMTSNLLCQQVLFK